MWAYILKFMAAHKDELIRTPAFSLGIFLLVGGDGSITSMSYIFGVFMCLSYLAHVVRKMLLPNLNLRKMYEKALDTPLAASIVTAASLWLTGSLVQTGVDLLKGLGQG